MFLATCNKLSHKRQRTAAAQLGAGPLKARQIIHDGGFGPEDLDLLDGVLDAAWKQIRDRYHDGDGTIARDRLASIIVTIGKARKDLNAGDLQAAAIEMFDRTDSSPPYISLTPFLPHAPERFGLGVFLLVHELTRRATALRPMFFTLDRCFKLRAFPDSAFASIVSDRFVYCHGSISAIKA